MRHIIVTLLTLILCVSCKTVKETVVTNDSIATVHLERTYGEHVYRNSAQTLIDRLVVITLNDKGDTLRRDETVKDYRREVEKETQKETTQVVDSTKESHSNVVTKTVVEEESFYTKLCKRTFPYLVTVLTLLVALLIIIWQIWYKKTS